VSIPLLFSSFLGLRLEPLLEATQAKRLFAKGVVQSSYQKVKPSLLLMVMWSQLREVQSGLTCPDLCPIFRCASRAARGHLLSDFRYR